MAHKIIIDGVIGYDYTAKDFRTELNKAKGQDVEIDILSPGGEAYNGIEIYNLVKNYKGKTTVNIGAYAASAASYIAVASDETTASENSSFMIHNAGTLTMGDHNDLRKTANKLEKISENLVRAYVSKTGKTSEEIRAFMDEETDFYGSEIVEAGFADRLVDSELEAVARDDSILNMLSAVETCVEMMKETDQKENLNKAVALLKQPIKTQKEETMTPEEIEAMKAENEKLKAEASAKVVEEPTAKEEVSVSDMALDILASASYPDSVKAVAKKVLKGEQSQENLEAIVAMSDLLTEKTKVEAAAEETKNTGDTPTAQDEEDKNSPTAKFKASVEAGKNALGATGEVQ